jgi:hypothetical protein
MTDLDTQIEAALIAFTAQRRFKTQFRIVRTMSDNVVEFKGKSMLSGDTPGPTTGNADALIAAEEARRNNLIYATDQDKYYHTPTGNFWTAQAVSRHLAAVKVTVDNEEKKIPVCVYIARHRAVDMTTWAPGEKLEIHNRLLIEGGWIDSLGAKMLNLYRAPTVKAKAGDPTPWIEHVRRVFPGEAEEIILWLAHRVQRPGEKINHAIVLGGAQGTGKDTVLEPVAVAIGPWNFTDASPAQFSETFNPFAKGVILRINEVHNLPDDERFQFYEKTKNYITAPPATTSVNDKFLRRHAIPNVTGVILTTNHKVGGLY